MSTRNCRPFLDGGTQQIRHQGGAGVIAPAGDGGSDSRVETLKLDDADTRTAAAIFHSGKPYQRLDNGKGSALSA